LKAGSLVSKERGYKDHSQVHIKRVGCIQGRPQLRYNSVNDKQTQDTRYGHDYFFPKTADHPNYAEKRQENVEEKL
jgi:hypothetical protein